MALAEMALAGVGERASGPAEVVRAAVVRSGFGVPGVPSPLSVLSAGAKGLATATLDAMVASFERGLAAATTDAFDAVARTVSSSAGTISFGPRSWWGAPGGAGATLWPTVVGIALSLMLGCVLLAVVQGALAGDPAMALRALAVEVPKSVLGIATLVALTTVVVGVVDDASAAVLGHAGTDLGRWLGATPAGGFMAVVVLSWALVAALAVWVELVVRGGLVLLLVALAPMVLAVRVWPAAAGLWRRLVEVAVALIVSKLVIAVALALGAAAMAGSMTTGPPSLAAMSTGAG